MFKRFIAFFLVLTMIFPTNFMGFSFAEGGPSISHIDTISWEGRSPKVGDKIFFIQVLGHNLQSPGNLNVEALLKEGDDFTKVASQMESTFLGLSDDGREVYISKMQMDGDLAIEDGKSYYLDVKDENGDSLLSEVDKYFNGSIPYSSISAGDMNIKEIPSDLNTLSLEFTAYIDNKDFLPTDLDIKLVEGNVLWGNPDGLMTPVADIIKNTMIVDEGLYGGYYISGDFNFYGDLSPGDRLYIQITLNSQVGYSYSSIKVLDGNNPTVTKFNVKNGFGSYNDSDHGGEHGTEGDLQSENVFYIDNDADYLDFEFIGTKMEDENKLTVTTDVYGIKTMVPTQTIINPLPNGLFKVNGKINDIPDEEFKIDVFYDNTPLEVATIKKTNLEGANSILYNNNWPYGEILEVMSDEPIELVLKKSLNISPSGITATLDGSSVNLTARKSENNDIEITLNPSSLSGEKNLELYYGGDRIKSLYYDYKFDDVSGTISEEKTLFSNSTLIYEQMPIIFNFNPDPIPLLKSVENQDNNLIIRGNGFSSGKTYTAYLLKKINSPLTAQPFEVNASFISSTELRINSSVLTSLPTGLYAVYLKEGQALINGFVDAALRTPKSGGPVVVLPTVKINNGELFTLTPQVTLSFNSGSYEQVRFAETESELNIASWQNIVSEIPYTLSEGYGNKTLYFQFKSSISSNYSLNKSIDYRKSDLDDMLEFGIQGAKKDGDSTILNEDIYYTFFVKSNQDNLTGIVEFFDDTDVEIPILKTEVKRTGKLDNTYTYSKKIKIDTSYSQAKKIRFYLKDKDGLLSNKEMLPINVQKEALITNSQTLFKTSYYDKYYVNKGSSVDYKLWGTPNFIVSAKLNYLGTDNTNKVKEIAFETNDKGQYATTQILPDDIAKVLSIEYTLTDPNNSLNKASKYKEENLEVTSTLNLKDLKNNDGAFNGKYLRVYIDNHWYGKSMEINNNGDNFTFSNLLPSNSYKYEISDNRKIYLSGSAELKSGQETNVNMNSEKKPAKIKFSVPDTLKGVSIYVKDYGYVYPGQYYDGFETGDTITYSFYLPYYLHKEFKQPDVTSYTVNNTLNDIDINLDKFEMITYKGTVIDNKLPDRKIEGVNISFQQEFTYNDSQYIYHYDSTTTDENGNFEIQLYKGYDGDLAFSKNGYFYKKIKPDTSNSSENNNIRMEYSTKNRLSINAFTRGLLEQGQNPNELELLSISNFKIKYIQILDGDKVIYSTYYTSQPYFILPGNVDNKTLRAKVDFFDMQSDKDYYDFTLDAYGNGSVDVLGVSDGVVKANVETNDNNLTAYMMIFDSSGRLSSILNGRGQFSSEQLALKNGNYTALFLKGNGLDKLGNMKTLEAFNFLGLNENAQYIKKTFTIRQGNIINLGKITIPNETFEENISKSENSIKTKFVPDNNTGLVHFLGRIKPEFPDPEAKVELSYIHVSTTGHFKNSEFYFNNNVVKPNNNPYTYYVRLDSPGDMTITGSVVPSTTDKFDLSFMLAYTINGKYHYETFGAGDVDMPKVSIVAPGEVFMNDGAKNVLVRGIGLPESDIEIYDNDILVGKVKIPANRTSYQTMINLSEPYIPVAHTLYAKMITKEKEEHLSSLKTCEIIDPDLMAYVSDFEYSHYSTITNKTPMDSSESIVATYVPGRSSSFKFRINNLLKNDLDYVAVKVSASGEERYYEATHDGDVDDGNDKYSKWKLSTVLEFPGDLSVYYALKENVPLGPISGTRPIDFEEAIKTPDVDLANIPEPIRASLSNRVIDKNSDTEMDMKIPIQGGGEVRLTGKFTENHRITEAELIAQGFTKFETNKGYYWTKESLRESGNNLELSKTIYFSPELTNILKSGYARISPFSGTQLAMDFGSDYSIRLALDTSDALSKADYAGYVYNVGEIVNDTSPNPLNMGKVGTGMNVVGGAVLVGQVLSGPTSKDHNTLYNACDGIDDILIRSRIQDDIREYGRARYSTHRINSLFGGISYGSGYFGLVGKGLSYIVSTGGMVYDKKVGAELDVWWDSIMRDIQNEIKLQEVRKNKKEKPPKPAKEDDIKKPRWKIDPSGYVFEAIDSNRIEGVESTAWVYNKALDDFFFWDDGEEWGEINPVLSDENGKYGWDVPEGKWKVVFEKEGYKRSETKSMDVPPAHEEVNIGLMSTKSPEVIGVAMDSSGIEVEFDMFMQGETFAGNIFVLDEYGDLMTLKDIEYIINTEDDVYKPDGVYQNDTVSSKDFVKRIKLVADDILGFKDFSDDGETPAKYKLIINGNVQSYAGVQMAVDYEKDDLTVAERKKLDLPTADIKGGSYESEQTIRLSTEAGATIYYTTDNSEPTALSSVYKKPIVVRKSAVLKFFASKVGMDNSEVAKEKYNIGIVRSIKEPEVPVVPEKPTIPDSGGSSGGGTGGGGGSVDTSKPKLTLDKNKTEVKIQGETIKGKLTASIDKATGDKLIENAKSNKSETILIEVESTNQLQNININHLKSFLKDVAQNTESTIEYKTLLAEISLSRKTILELSKEKGETFTLSIEKANDTISIILKMDDRILTKVNGDIKVELPKIRPSVNTVVMMVDENGRSKVIPKSIFRDDTILATINGSNTLRILENKKAFGDIENHWAKESIGYITARELFLGTDIEVFSPNLPMTRGMLVTVLHRLEGQVKTSTTSFEDVDENKYYAPAVYWASSNGIVEGVGEGIFAPDRVITREQLAVMIYRYGAALGLDTSSKNDSISDFKDSDQVSSWASNAMNYAIDTGLISGKNGSLVPKGNATRGEVATILYRFMQSTFN